MTGEYLQVSILPGCKRSALCIVSEDGGTLTPIAYFNKPEYVDRFIEIVSRCK